MSLPCPSSSCGAVLSALWLESVSCAGVEAPCAAYFVIFPEVFGYSEGAALSSMALLWNTMGLQAGLEGWGTCRHS